MAWDKHEDAGSLGRPWRRARAAALKRDNYLCVVCARRGHVTKAVTVDHIIPRSKGGAVLDQDNLQSLCQDCHDVKTNAEDRGQEAWLGVAEDGTPIAYDHAPTTIRAELPPKPKRYTSFAFGSAEPEAGQGFGDGSTGGGHPPGARSA